MGFASRIDDDHLNIWVGLRGDGIECLCKRGPIHASGNDADKILRGILQDDPYVKPKKRWQKVTVAGWGESLTAEHLPSPAYASILPIFLHGKP